MPPVGRSLCVLPPELLLPERCIVCWKRVEGRFRARVGPIVQFVFIATSYLRKAVSSNCKLLNLNVCMTTRHMHADICQDCLLSVRMRSNSSIR